MNTFLLRDDHVVVAKHLRDERTRNDNTYATKTEVGDIQSDRIVSTTDPNKGLIITNGEVQATLDINLGESGEIYKFRPSPAQYGISLISRNDGDARYVQKDENNLNNVLSPTEDYSFNNKKLIDLAPGTLGTDAVTKAQLDLKKDTGTFDTKIQNATAKTAISCDGDRYISIKSNNVKIADILEDEQNQGFTLLTNNKRLNLVSTQPQTFYHNSGTSLYNFKYTDDANQVAGQARFGQIQLAPSNTTNINPALTLSSSRVNGLGTAAAIYCDSSYGQSSTPLILSAQSLTDASANQLQMFRSTAAPAIKNQFTAKTGYASDVAITEPQQFTSKVYTDTALAAKLDKSGGIMTGHIELVGQPELSTHAVNRDYVDQVENSLVKKSGSTMTGDLILSGPPTSDLMASTKKYVDDQVATVQTGTPSELIDANASDGNIYRIRVRNNQIEFYRNDDDLYLNLFGSTTGMILDTPKTNVFIESSLSNATEMNLYRRPRSGTAATASIPQFRIQQTTFAASGLQYTRLSTQNMVAGSDTAITMYPDLNANNSIVNRVTFNQRVGYQEDVNTTSTGINDYTLLCRQMADELYTPIGSAAGASITNGSNIVMTAQATDVTVEDSTDTDNGYLVLTNRSVRNDNGTTLFLARGDSSIVIVDEGPLGEKGIRLNQPLSYESGSVGSITRDEEIPSRLMCDGRYHRQDQDIDLGFANRIRGLPSPLIPSEPVTLGMFDNALLYFRQCVTFGFTVLEVPSSPEAFASDANAITNITYTETGAGVAGFYTLSVDPNLFGGSNYVVTCQWASTRSGVSIVDSQVAPIVVNGYQRTSFNLYVRDTTGGTQQNQIIGTLTARGW